MHGWTGRILRVDLNRLEHSFQKLDGDFARKWVGGRGFASRILWEELEPGTDPLGPDNELIIARGPLTGLLAPSSGKLVVAAKSPLTGGYGDGNIGTTASVELGKAGYDAIIIRGRAPRHSMLVVEDNKVSVEPAEDIWGLDTFEAERRLRKTYGRFAGILVIGPAGENLVRYATIISQEGRSGGRPGIGAVMGSKNLKAVVIKGSGEVPVADKKELVKTATQAFRDIKHKPNYEFWMRQGTMMTVQWGQENSVLPAYNYSEGVFEASESMDGYAMERVKVTQRGCPNCNMTCGNVVLDEEGKESELDYENVAMLGSNIGLGDIRKIAVLNRLADMYGLDTISLGNTIGFAMEASEKGLLEEKLEWGDYERVRELIGEIARREGLGGLLAEGTRRMAERLGGEAYKFAMNVKGLETSAYDCHATPGMALAFATSPIGAHHKDAWVISWEVSTDRLSYGREKAAKVIEHQRIRGGMFESLVTCRLPWIEVGLDLDYYPRLFKAATGISMSLDDFMALGDRIYAQIRAFWIREYGSWDRRYDQPPAKWFEKPLTKGPLKGAKLDYTRYQGLLDHYYDLRGWDTRGIPRRGTLRRLGLEDVAEELDRIVGLSE